MTREEFGERVKRARLRSGLTQEAVCMRAGITQQTLSHIENGRKGVRVETMMLLAEGIGCSPAEFFEEDA